MTEELELKLVKKYPKIMRDYKGDMMVTCMAWGIECDDGWYDILDECMQNLQYFCDLCSKDGREVQVVAAQIKEKFGTLRFYTDDYGVNQIEHKIISMIISNAESKSKSTCEDTGRTNAKLCNKGRWLKTLSKDSSKNLGFEPVDPKVKTFWNDEKNI
jgi:hypothetical protein